MEDDELTAEIQAQVDEWSSSSNECTELQFVRTSDGSVTSFNPEFTYPIFGEEEAIFGYRDLKITISFAAHDLRPHLSVKYGQIFEAQGEVRPTDVVEALRDFLPAEAFVTEAEKSEADEEDAIKATGFTPPGERIHDYSRDGKHFEIWCASLADARAKQLLERMQILVPMFIEGGSMLQLEQDWTTQRWKLFLLYQSKGGTIRTGSEYSLVGYGTSYRVFTLPDRQSPSQADLDLFTPTSTSLESILPSKDPAPTSLTSPLDLPSRERLSQFLILPPFQGSGHGHALYTTMYTHLTTPANIREFTVEDPNEAFDDLRDACDLLHLRTHHPSFAALRINPDLPTSSLAATSPIPTSLIVPTTSTRDAIRAQTKIMPRQFDRLVEMHTLSFIPPLHRSRNRLTKKERSSNAHDRAFYLWRLYAKQRLYVFNRDQLAQVEREERVVRLEAVVDSVMEGYGKVLERVEAEEARVTDGEEGLEKSVPARVRKRKVVGGDEDEEEEEDEGGDEEGEKMTNGHKKARVSVQ